MDKYYLSKNYKDAGNAGNKAKMDIEEILSGWCYYNAGCRQTHYTNAVLGFLITLAGVLKFPFSISSGGLVVLQYPLKKYYTFVCRMAHWRGCRVITVIHDLGSFRRKKLTVAQEIARLNHSDYLIVHNTRMRDWLQEKGYRKPMGCLEIFDYLSSTVAPWRKGMHEPKEVVYAGGLGYKKNAFLYGMDELMHSWHFNLYGRGFEEERIRNRSHFTYKGFVPSDQLILSAEGDFGLVWDGESVDTCTGAFGEYLQYNNPHKTSLYIRCELPVIVWSKAAIASFVRANEIGLCIDSLQELDAALASITPQEYQRMRQNIIKISAQLSVGHYMGRAIREAETCLGDR